jgi:putative copper export protein/mono/diheme cytochrome c family protein
MPGVRTRQPSATRLTRMIWASLVVGILSGLLWLILEARSMSGKSIGDVFSQGLLGTVLTRTRFGHDWELRGLLAVPLVFCLILAGRRPRSGFATMGFWTALLLSAVQLAMIAGAGHAAAGTGWPGYLHIFGDGVHLLAAGAWVGGLLPLALLFAAARRDNSSACVLAARAAALRFSVVGLLAVGTLLATGLLNTVFLVGNVPALVGTDYGHLLMLKVALFLIMATFAAINRQWLTPQLSSDIPSGSKARANWDTLRLMQRNSLIEAGLGACVLIVLGALGTTPPALHVQPQWPLPFRLSLAEIETLPAVRIQVIGATAVALCGVALLGYGLIRPRQRSVPILVGLFLFLAVGWWPFQFMVVTAYPTSFYRSSVPLTARSMVRGAHVYSENCAGCNGSEGSGDGPLAKNLQVAPADLTAEHIFAHSDGDLFWWISQGISAGGMPGLAETVDERGRWEVINFIHARAAALQPLELLPEVTARSAPLAPDFSFEQGRSQGTLRQAIETGSLLLVLYRLPTSLSRLQQLDVAKTEISSAGLRLLAVPIDPQPGEAEATPELPDFVATTDADTAKQYALFEGSGQVRHCEFLIDRAGFLRARWRPGTGSGLADASGLLAQLRRLAELPLHQEQPHAHAHTH